MQAQIITQPDAGAVRVGGMLGVGMENAPEVRSFEARSSQQAAFSDVHTGPPPIADDMALLSWLALVVVTVAALAFLGIDSLLFERETRS